MIRKIPLKDDWQFQGHGATYVLGGPFCSTPRTKDKIAETKGWSCLIKWNLMAASVPLWPCSHSLRVSTSSIVVVVVWFKVKLYLS